MRLWYTARRVLSGRDLGSRDLVVAVLAVTLVVLFAFDHDNDLPAGGEPRALDLLAGGLFVAASAALLVRRRWPLLVMAFVLAINGTWHTLSYTSGLVNLPTFFAAYGVGLTGDRRRQALGLLIGTVPVTLAVLFLSPDGVDQPREGLVDAVGWMIVAVLLGEVVQSRQLLLAAYRQRAERAEAEREAEARRRVGEERMRIARDLHDLLGHTVSLMMVQAGVAADALPEHPDRASDAITALRRAGRQATSEIQATVELLRQHDPAELAPSPTTADLAALIESVRQLGIDVETTIDPEVFEVAPLLQLTIYRVVQEALTNVTRHADATQVTLEVVTENDGVRISVGDDGCGPDGADGAHGADTSGYGLVGMRERAALAGGTVSYGAGPDGGVLLTARLPAPPPTQQAKAR